jgi:hypothetical protein
VQDFDPETRQVHKDEQGQPQVQRLIDWQISAGLSGGKNRKILILRLLTDTKYIQSPNVAFSRPRLPHCPDVAITLIQS